MNKIAVITTGGTIGSILKSNSFSVDESEVRIFKEIQKAQRRLGYEIDTFPAFNKNSENIKPDDWITLMLKIMEVDQSQKYHGIVVTHGTDTLVYSIASVISFAHLWSSKICFTGAYYAPDEPTSDTSLNLLAALEFAATPHPSTGVYLAFRSDSYNTEAHIINGFHVKPMWYDDLCFESSYAEEVAIFNPNKGISKNTSLRFINSPVLPIQNIAISGSIQKHATRSCMLNLYPGISATDILTVANLKEIIVIATYHSGTGPTSDEDEDSFLRGLVRKTEHSLVLMGSFPSRNIHTPYESTRKLIACGAHVYKELQPHFLFVFSLLGKACGVSDSEILKALEPWELKNED